MIRSLPDVPLSTEASMLIARIRPAIALELGTIARIPVAVLLWGPSPDSASPLGDLRLGLRAELRSLGHAAFCSEELVDPATGHSVRVQELVQAQQFDLVVSFPDSPGSIAEAHDFAIDARVRARVLLGLNKEHVIGYSGQSLALLNHVGGCTVIYYDGYADVAVLREAVLLDVQKIREVKYLLAGRNVL